jgi:hypothetical protein
MNSIISEKVERFTKNIGSRHFNDSDYVAKLRDNLNDFRNPKYNVDFLMGIINQLKIQLTEHEKDCKHTPQTCNYSISHQKAIFYTSDELSYHLIPIDEDKIKALNVPFSDGEIIKLKDKIDKILEHLNKLGLGQEIIFDEIQVMRYSASQLTKKDFKMLFLGKVISTGFMKLINDKDFINYFEALV